VAVIVVFELKESWITITLTAAVTHLVEMPKQLLLLLLLVVVVVVVVIVIVKN
jgi:hypothetical protein